MKNVLTAFVILLCIVSGASADETYISTQSAKQPIDKAFRNVVEALKRSGFFIAKEIDIGQNLEKDSIDQDWTDYNKNNLGGIRTAVLCRGKAANAISNLDPKMLVVCPLHITVFQEGEWTRVEFIKPAAIAHGSPAEPVALELQEKIEAAIREGLEQKEPAK